MARLTWDELTAELPIGTFITVRLAEGVGAATAMIHKWCDPRTTGHLWFEWQRITMTGRLTGHAGIAMVEQENTDWARGWDTPEANAFLTMIALES